MGNAVSPVCVLLVAAAILRAAGADVDPVALAVEAARRARPPRTSADLAAAARAAQAVVAAARIPPPSQ